MLISFNELWKDFAIKAEGVVHVGAHRGQELPEYYANGIKRSIWVEAIPQIYRYLQLKTSKYPNAVAINAVVGAENNKLVNFNIANNDGQSSSVLELGTHKTAHPEVKFLRSVTLPSFRLDFLLQPYVVEGKLPYTFLNIDLQGAELIALKSLGALLDGFEYIYTEVNKAELYVGCPLVEDIDAYLKPFGFERVRTHWEGNFNWGDAFYIKNGK